MYTYIYIYVYIHTDIIHVCIYIYILRERVNACIYILYMSVYTYRPSGNQTALQVSSHVAEPLLELFRPAGGGGSQADADGDTAASGDRGSHRPKGSLIV